MLLWPRPSSTPEHRAERVLGAARRRLGRNGHAARPRPRAAGDPHRRPRGPRAVPGAVDRRDHARDHPRQGRPLHGRPAEGATGSSACCSASHRSRSSCCSSSCCSGSAQGGRGLLEFGRKTRPVKRPTVTFADVAGLPGGGRGAHRDPRLPRRSGALRAHGRAHPEGCAARRPARARARRCWRAPVAGEAEVPFFSLSGSDFVEMFVGRRRVARAQAVPAGEGRGAGDHLHRRARRGRPPSGRRRGRRARRARADAQPAARRDGRFRRHQRRHRPRVDEPPRHPRSGAAAPGSLRPSDRRRPARRRRPDRGPQRAHPRRHPRRRRRSRGAGSPYRRVHGRRPREPRERGRAARNAPRCAPRSRSRTSRRRSTGWWPGRSGGAGCSRTPSAGSSPTTRAGTRSSATLSGTDPVHRITIIPRGQTLGSTLSLPTEDRFLVRRSELLAQLAMLLGGRAAEELVFVDPTTGARDDIARATTIARQMVTEFGMSDGLGPMRFGQPAGRGVPRTRLLVDARLLGRDRGPHRRRGAGARSTDAHAEARRVLTLHRAALDRLVAGAAGARNAPSGRGRRDPRGGGARGGAGARWCATIGARHPRDREHRVSDARHPTAPARSADRRCDLDRIARAVREILIAVGEDPERDGLVATPDRVARMYAEIFVGLREDPGPAPHGHVRGRATTRWSWCGTSRCTRRASTTWCRSTAWPTSRTSPATTGASPGCRSWPGWSRATPGGPQVQERLTSQIADAMVESLRPKGVFVVLECEHLCMSMRGVRKPGTLTVTSAVRGIFKANAATRAEAMALVGAPESGSGRRPLRGSGPRPRGVGHPGSACTLQAECSGGRRSRGRSWVS